MSAFAHPRIDPESGICEYFSAGQCESCSLMRTPHDAQIREARNHLHSLLAHAMTPATVWEEPLVSAPWGFRTKAKMMVRGTANAPVFSFPGTHEGVDLADCPLYPALVTDVLDSARALIRRAQVPPYNLDKRRGEIKYVLVTATQTEAMVRLVLRSTSALERIREHLALLDPRVSVVSANIHPEHEALIEGAEEIHLAGADRLRLPVGGIDVDVLPRSFTQTNTAVASELYAQVARWILDAGAHKAWDLYCGVGGFALSIAHEARARGAHMDVTGIEITNEAIESARGSAKRHGFAGAVGPLTAPGPSVRAHFDTADATEWARHQPNLPEAVVVNPPRRGIGDALATVLNGSGARTIAYSSCNPETL
ncbi:MAG: 23S rRNA (uracil(747)-C(5))-methyltransferase, partial [Dermabacter sp.]|nr:23S rRNA (uracil(747)-C(5))-methyltransferase [Dermabacter sp.]